MNYTDNEIKHILSQKLPSKRYLHISGVCETAVKMARKFGIDEQKAYMAALLHDCVKYMTTDELIESANSLGVELSGEDIECPQVIHAPLGAQIAKIEYGVEDTEIYRFRCCGYSIAHFFDFVNTENQSFLKNLVLTTPTSCGIIKVSKRR